MPTLPPSPSAFAFLVGYTVTADGVTVWKRAGDGWEVASE